MDQAMSVQLVTPPRVKPRLGFLGLGWIGQHRLQSIIKSGSAEVAALADSVNEAVSKARDLAPEANIGENLDDLIEMNLDGIVIATPSALHAAQAQRALEHGLSVFCQK